MTLNISAWSIRRPLPSIVMSIILLLLGWTSLSRLPITRLPNADIPVVSVVVTQFGEAPAELEAQVTKTIEDGVSGVEGVRHITSSITDGISVTTVIFGSRPIRIAPSTTSRMRSPAFGPIFREMSRNR
jgi:multidrug efflux pump subunit AcrB